MELITQDQATAITSLDDTARATQLAIANAEKAGSAMLKAIVLSKGMNRLRQLLTDDLLGDLMALQGSSLGFRTDKDHEGGYPLKVVRDVTLEATIRGFRMVGNEVNIIGGRFYPTKEGYERLVKEWPGLSDLNIEMEYPEITSQFATARTKDGKEYSKETTYARIAAVARWKLNNVPMEIVRRNDGKRDLRIVVRLNAGMVHDAAYGKAEARIYRLIAKRLSGLHLPDEEPAEDDVLEPAEEPIDLGAWGEHAEKIADQVDQCTDREQLEKVYKQWHAYASNEAREAQLVNVCAAKAAKL